MVRGRNARPGWVSRLVYGSPQPAARSGSAGAASAIRRPVQQSPNHRRSVMAGHSQFKNIMHRKGRQDKVRAQLFTQLQREIQVASKAGQPDPAFNPRLRAAIQAAQVANMPKDNIERAIKRGQGGDGGELRRGALRGLRARWRRGHRRGADRQSQPYRRAPCARASASMAGRWARPIASASSSTASASDHYPAPGGQRRCHARGRDRGRSRRLRELRGGPRGHLRPGRARRRAGTAGGSISGRPSSAVLTWKPQIMRRRSTTTRPSLVQAARGAGRQ